MKSSSLGKSFVVGFLGVCTTGCYTLKQGYHQAKLIFQRTPLEKVLSEGKESTERLSKLKVVPSVLEFARSEIGLETGKSYTHYIALEGPSVTYVVQAASKRELKLKTWWFPIVGSQPYLGFFKQDDAKKFREELVADGFDTTLGGVQAFSLLGFFPDPLYSSMIDGNSFAEIIEVLIHESVHQTLYIPDHSAFNENMADFIAKRATVEFLKRHPEIQSDIAAYQTEYTRNLAAQVKFKEFLIAIKAELEQFYDFAKSNPQLAADDVFLKERQRKFDDVSERYTRHMAGLEKGTSYEFAFRKGRINNAVILGYSLYEAKQAPFEKALAAAGGNLKTLMENLKRCLKDPDSDSEKLWMQVEQCQ